MKDAQKPDEVRKVEAETMNERQPINVTTRGCMDGRKILMRLRLNTDGSVTIVTDKQKSAEVVEAKLPGADLGFIAVLQNETVMGGNDQLMADEAAFGLVTETLKEMGLEPQFHVDNHHGEMEIPEAAELLKELVKALEAGCGFAGRTWGEKAGVIIALAKKFGWTIEILDGGHHEGSAEEYEAEGEAVNNSVAVANHRARFSFNLKETMAILKRMEGKLGTEHSGFADRAMDWFKSEFKAIAGALSNGQITEVTKVQ